MSRADALVDAEWAEAHLDDPKVVFVEVDEDVSAYDKNHIRGAVRVDWTQDLQDPVKRDFVDQADFEKLLSSKGISNDDTVVLYGGNNNWFAAYAYWYFKLYGHPGRAPARRWPQEVGARLPPAGDRADRAARHRVQGPAAAHRHPGVPRRGGRRHRQAEPGRRALAGRVQRQAARPRASAAGAVAEGGSRADAP